MRKKTREVFNGNLEELLTRVNSSKSPHVDYFLNNKWTGDAFTALTQATKKIEAGDPQLLKKFKEAEQTELTTALATKQTYHPATEGLFFSVAAYLAGEPEHWLQEVEEETPQGKASDIYINMAASSAVTTDQVLKKLVHIAQLIDSAEHKGQRLNVFITVTGTPSKSNKHKEKVSFTVQIKRECEPVNIQQLVYLVATPILFRFCFLLLNSETVGGNFGSYTTELSDEDQLINDPQIIYIPSFYYDQRNRINNYTDLTTIYPHLKSKL